MRLLALSSLALAACTIPNPAFLGSAMRPETATDAAATTELGSSGAPTGSASASGTTGALPTTEPGVSGDVSGEPDTTASSTTTTDPSGSSSNATSTSGSSGTSGEPLPICQLPVDSPLPLVELRKADDTPMDASECAKFADATYSCKYTANASGLYLQDDPNCETLPFGVKVVTPLLGEAQVYGTSACIDVTLEAYEQDGSCWLRRVALAEAGDTFAWGEFEVEPVYSFQGLAAAGKLASACGCSNCCGPDPGQYIFLIGDLVASEALPPVLAVGVDKATYLFSNLRSHVHEGCGPELFESRWRHLDYFITRLH